MRRLILPAVVLVALAVAGIGTTTASAAPTPSAPSFSAPASLIKPLWTKANAFWRTREWIEYDRSSPSYEPYECHEFSGKTHGVTQWACYGEMYYSYIEKKYWQVNIDAYGEQTYWNDSNSPL
jgi:hypothetical protein